MRERKTHYAPHLLAPGIHIAMAAVCGQIYDYQRTGDRAKVTCGSCLRIMEKSK